MKVLVFTASDVRRVVEHTLRSPKHRGAGPSVLLVHDEGVYLMSSGEPRDIVEGERSFCAYARGCHPTLDPDCWDTARALVGGDDFVEYLPWVADLAARVAAGRKTIEIGIDGENLVLVGEEV